jgi:EpsG family
VARLSSLSICILIAVVCSVLSVSNNIASDYVAYGELYKGLQFGDFSTCEGVEIGWCIPSMLFHEMAFDYAHVAFLFSLLIYSLVLIFILDTLDEYRIKQWYAILAIVFFTVFIIRPEMASHLTRQYLAAMFLMLSMSATGRLWRIFWFSIAALFHISILFLFPVVLAAHYGGFTARRIFGTLVVLGAALIFLKSNFSIQLADWALSINVRPRILYNVFFKLKNVSHQYGFVSSWKCLLIFMGIFPALLFLQKKAVKFFAECYLYYIVFMIFIYFASPIYFERFFHYGKIFLFYSLMIAMCEVAVGRFKERVSI